MSLTSVHAPVQMFCSIGHVNFVLSSPFTIAWKMSVTAKWLCTEQFLIYRSFALQPLLLSILKHFLNSAICTSCKGEIWQRWIIKPHYKTSCYHQLFLTPQKKFRLALFLLHLQSKWSAKTFWLRHPANTQHASFFQVMNNNLSSKGKQV